ncbi:hypothetical protein L3Q82_013746 [Scortum barcoo]|uniref:Uncharacterized protein n=1 Tax=Scortum barcoo TaxID=214431 RepID=A0ACB8W1C9_9TELE|nr:hypothetical protein L3Q82_013746 [Scortum barcoo]
MLWKTSCLVPVPKKSKAIRPGRLQTSRPHISCDEGPGETGLSPAEATVPFNTIQPLLLGEKLQVMGVDDTMISWITDYLTGRPQFVRLGSVLSDVVVSDTGAPQGTVLSPFLFTLYTTDFQYNSESCHLQKFSDDSAVVGCIREGEEGGRRCLHSHYGIRGEVVEEVEDYKYLGVVIDNRLDWKSNTEAVYKKGMSRLYLGVPCDTVMMSHRSYKLTRPAPHLYYPVLLLLQEPMRAFLL